MRQYAHHFPIKERDAPVMFNSIKVHFLGEMSRPIKVRVKVSRVDTLDKENVRL
jgi:hypothetical protein